MYFGGSDEFNIYSRLDIDGGKDIVKLSIHEMDNKSRKNIANYLRKRICEYEYRFKKGIDINQNEKFEIVITDKDIDFNNMDSLYLGNIEFKRKRFKDMYDNVHMFLVIKDGEDSYFLKEGDRYLSQEESCHMIDLIDKPGSITFIVDVDTWIKIKMD